LQAQVRRQRLCLSLVVGQLEEMSDFYTRKPLPKARIVFYGFLAAAAVAALGYFQHEPKLYIFAGIAGLFIGGFGFLASSARALKPLPGGYPRLISFPAWLRWTLIVLFVIGIFASIVATVLDILQRR
jgi:hypothetical protein